MKLLPLFILFILTTFPVEIQSQEEPDLSIESIQITFFDGRTIKYCATIKNVSSAKNSLIHNFGQEAWKNVGIQAFLRTDNDTETDCEADRPAGGTILILKVKFGFEQKPSNQ